MDHEAPIGVLGYDPDIMSPRGSVSVGVAAQPGGPSVSPLGPGAPTGKAAVGLELTAEDEALVARAAAILAHADMTEGERRVRLHVVRAALTGTVIRPTDDSPEMRNPAFWVLVNDRFVVAPGIAPVDAIADLWVLHGADGVPVPRIRCLKYTTLVLIQGIIRHFHDTENALGLEAINRLLGRRVIPEELPNRGDDVLWRRHFDSSRLLPGDQVWFDNPFFDRGRELLRQRFHQEALHAGAPPDAAQRAAIVRAEAMTAGEEGSNAFYLGEDRFILGADSLVRAFRGSARDAAVHRPAAHEMVFTRKIFSLARFREHMIADNFSAQACLRADADSVHPACFTIERVRAPLDPVHLLRFHASQTPEQELGSLISAMASANPPPRLDRRGQVLVPTFSAHYDWDEQQRVRLAIDAVMRADPDAIWWTLREHMDDERYVLTATRGRDVRNFTVGMLCGDLADARLCLCFTRRLPLVPGRLPATFQPEREFVRQESRWRAARMPLFAMQAALCEAAIREWDHVMKTEPGADGRSHRFSAEEKARYVVALREEIAEVTRTRRAACEEVVLPCLPAPVGWDGFDAELARESIV